MAPHVIHDILQPLVAYGFYPPALKNTDGIVWDKPWYDSPSSFPLMVLL